MGRDFGRKVARIDYATMDSLGVAAGDIIEITGRKTTLVKCLPLYPSDEDKHIIRIDANYDYNNY